MNDDLHTTGRRASDNGALTIREAYDLFTPKAETAALAAAITLISNRVAELPSRAELKVHWDAETERYQRLEDRVREDRDANREALNKIESKVDTLLAGRLPKWALPALTVVAMIVIPIIVLVVSHYWR